MKKSTAEKIMDAVIGIAKPSGLQKINCLGCGLPTQRRHIIAEYGLCTECYMGYCEDMRIKYEEEASSDSIAYREAH